VFISFHKWFSQAECKFSLHRTNSIYNSNRFYLKYIVLGFVKKENWLFWVFMLGVALVLSNEIRAQEKLPNPNGFNRFYFDNGMLSSEGNLKSGKPEGYWKNYYENGKLKSEGNRKDFLLDGYWKFYTEEGVLVDEIQYQAGKRMGVTSKYSNEGFLESSTPYVNDVKQGVAFTYFDNGGVHMEIPFDNGAENGKAYQFNPQGDIISVLHYKQGVLQKQELINRKDKDGQKEGVWKEFYSDRTVKTEGTFRNDQRDGYWKEYSERGELLQTTKYVDGVYVEDAEELSDLNVKESYYEKGKGEGKLKFRGTYREGKKQGTHIWFNEDGSIDSTKVYRNGFLIAEGKLDISGMRMGFWKEYYYPTGELKSEGEYKLGYRFGDWKFYYLSGVEQEKGRYTDLGKTDGKWIWYYENGAILREETFRNGKENGPLVEYNDTGKIIIRGQFLDGKQEGEWVFEVGDHKEIGVFENGYKQGEWNHYFLTNGQKRFQGEFFDDLAQGKHTWFYDNGQKRLEGKFVSGVKEGPWRRYNLDGTIFLEIEYQSGREAKVDGQKQDDPPSGDSLGEE